MGISTQRGAEAEPRVKESGKHRAVKRDKMRRKIDRTVGSLAGRVEDHP